jgi:hypothetical protein
VATADAENPAKQQNVWLNRFEHEVAIASSGIIGKIDTNSISFSSCSLYVRHLHHNALVSQFEPE